MNCKTQWILWAIAMGIFLGLALSGRMVDLGLAIAAVAVLWYVIVPALNSGRQ
jgi:dolichyl-phosphate-mannose--protein O-mannosyl transferase